MPLLARRRENPGIIDTRMPVDSGLVVPALRKRFARWAADAVPLRSGTAQLRVLLS
jgi:hypothetical protein